MNFPPVFRVARCFLPLLGLAMVSCSVMHDIRKADRHYDYGEFTQAATVYGKAYRRIKSTDKALRAEVAFKQGECYRRTNQSVKAETAYAKAIRYRLDNDTVYLRYAAALHKNGKYKPAITHYGTFLDTHPDDVQAQNGLFACTCVEEWKSQSRPYVVKKSARLNLKKGNFCPVLIPSEYKSVVFTSSALHKEGVKPSKITGLPENDFFIALQSQYGQWEKPLPIEGPINSEFDEGGGCFDATGGTFYFTRCITQSDRKGAGSKAAICRSRRSGDQWGEPEVLDVTKDTTWLYAHPAISPDDRYLYFVSDRPGGYGGKDIWRCEMSGSTFGPPENLGPDVNTPGDEMFPYVRSTGELYFSSDGLPGLGGLDLFQAKLNDADSVIQVVNLIALNSNADDFGISFCGKNDEGLFSSNRGEAKGTDKIYEFSRPGRLVEVSGLVCDRQGEPIPDATIRIVNDKGTNTKLRSRRDGTYSYEIEKDANYLMLGTCRGYLNASAMFYSKDKDTSYVEDFVLTSLRLPVRIDNIFFAFDSWELLPESYPALEELLKVLLDNPHVVIEIGAHTDRKGSQAYNERLSLRRAEAVVAYLVSLGVEKERLKAQGYGQSKPTKVDEAISAQYPFLNEGRILDESYIESLPLSQQDICDQINRRCEFKVLKTTYKLF